MARRVVYTNGNTYHAGAGSELWRKNSSLEVVDWLNSLPGSEVNGKRVKEVVNFQIHYRTTWECFALVELEE
ncbi:MAG: hypothetical protein ACK4QL_05805 [Pseudanabaenaceae cyanobacterium]